MTTDSEQLDLRLTELEVKLSFVDDTVSGLSTADVEQSQRLAALERAVRELRSEISGMRTGFGPDAQAEPPPPHY